MTAHVFLRDPNDRIGAPDAGRGSRVATVPLENHLSAILEAFIRSHWRDIEAALIDAGMDPSVQVLLPGWERMATVADIALVGTIEEQRDAVLDVMAQVNAAASHARR